MPIMDGFVFDAAGARLLEEASPPNWLTQLDDALPALQEEFRREDEEGYAALVNRLRAWTWCHQVPRDHPDYVSLESLAELAGHDQALERARTGDVGALADVDEQMARANGHRLQAGQLHRG
ncbi:MAG TPA: hypothetical protein PK878_11075, partial [bacterium]|nr:hypothetical protein [bacterium]